MRHKHNESVGSMNAMYGGNNRVNERALNFSNYLPFFFFFFSRVFDYIAFLSPTKWYQSYYDPNGNIGHNRKVMVRE